MRHTVVEELVDFAYPGFYTHLNLIALCGTISTVQLHLLLAVNKFCAVYQCFAAALVHILSLKLL